MAESSLQTASEPACIILSADRSEIKAGGQDLCYVIVRICDSQGNIVPWADNAVKFFIDGPGEIFAVGSSNPVSSESYKKPLRKAYQGRLLVILRSGKERSNFRLKAESEGLHPTEISIKII